MKHVYLLVAALSLTACGSSDKTPIWSPGTPVPQMTVVPEPHEVAPLGARVPSPPSGLIRYQSGPKDPRVTSKAPLSRPERRALQDGRQDTNTEIRSLERRAHFNGDDMRAVDERRLSDLKARQRSVIRRLRGD